MGIKKYRKATKRWLKDVRRKRRKTPGYQVLSQSTILIWAITLISISVGSVWGMLYFFGNDPKASSRLEAIRIASTVVIGTGGGAALLLTARRQRFTEIDGTERRITELQTKAADQLGHEKAAVRLAGLHSLERLAQDHQSHRQTIVNIICAYLRMPFIPPPERQPRKPPIAQSLRQRREPLIERTLARDIEDLYEEKRQELEVRLTAQEILHVHLMKDDDRPEQYWPGMKLNLKGAILVNFSLSGAILSDLDCDGATFFGKYATFSGIITNVIWMPNAKFKADAHLDRTTAMLAVYEGTTFTRSANFQQANYGDIKLEGTQFLGTADFTSSHHLAADAPFTNATFHDIAKFDDVKRAREDELLLAGALFSKRSIAEQVAKTISPGLSIQQTAYGYFQIVDHHK